MSLGFVADGPDGVCGFILGRIISIVENTLKFGEILILGVHPDYQRNGVCTKLIDGLCNELLSKGINVLGVGVIPYDEDLVAFFESSGFNRGPLLSYIKVL